MAGRILKRPLAGVLAGLFSVFLMAGGSAHAKAPEESDYEIASLIAGLPSVVRVLEEWLVPEEIAKYESLAERHQAAIKQDQEAQFGQDFLKLLDTTLVSHPRLQRHTRALRSGLRAAAHSRDGFAAIQAYNRGRRPQAVRALEELLSDPPQGFTALHLAWLAMPSFARGDIAETDYVRILNKAVNHAPGEPLLWVELMQAARRAGDDAQISKIFKEAQSYAPDKIASARLLVGLAQIRFEQGDHERLMRIALMGEREIEHELERDHKQPDLGRTFVELLGLELEALTAYSQLEAAVGIARKQLHHVNQLILISKDDIPLRTMRTDTYLHLARLLYGLEDFENAKLYFTRGRIYHAEAMRTYPRNRSSRAGFALLSLKLGDVLAHMDQPAEAERTLNEGVEIAKQLSWSDDTDPQAWRLLGDINLHLSQIKQAAKDYDGALANARVVVTAREKLIALEPETWWHRAVLISAHVLTAEIERDRGDEKAALAALDAAAKANDDLATEKPGLSVTDSTRKKLAAMRRQLTGDAPDVSAAAPESGEPLNLLAETQAAGEPQEPAEAPQEQDAPVLTKTRPVESVEPVEPDSPKAEEAPAEEVPAEDSPKAEPQPEPEMVTEPVTEPAPVSEPEPQPAAAPEPAPQPEPQAESGPRKDLTTEDVLGIEQLSPQGNEIDAPAADGRTSRVPTTEAEDRIKQLPRTGQ